MGKRVIRPQNPKNRAMGRIYRVQELRRSNAAEPIPSRNRYDRNDFRRNIQRGVWED
jgi:hypothetical protein